MAVSARIWVSPAALQVVARDRVGAPGALEQHHALDQVGIDTGVISGPLDVGAESLHALRGGENPSGALRVDHVAVPGRGARLELLLAVGLVGVRVALDLDGL